MEEIEKLLSDNKYFEAFIIIQKELKKGYDFSDSKQRKTYHQLNTWKSLCLNAFLDILHCGKLPDEINYDNGLFKHLTSKIDGDSWTGISKTFNIEIPMVGMGAAIKTLRTSDHKKIISNIKTTVKDSSYKNGMDAYISITTGKQESYLSDTANGCAVIKISDSLSEFDLKGFAESLTKLFNAILSKRRIRNIGVIIDIKDGFNNEEDQRVLLLVLLANILSNCVQLLDYYNVPVLTLLSKDQRQLDIINCLIDEIQGKDKIPGFVKLSKRLSAQVLIEKCLTSNTEYKSRLEALSKVIDEPDVPILILGESGVGKSFLAESVHFTSNRNKQPFVSVNCGGISENMLYQTLWGWKKGSFTGAAEGGKGAVQRADGGTLFLDEIDRASREVRDSLLTFIETKKYVSLGDTEKIANIRLIFGTNKNLRELVSNGEFEEDFYNRITQRVIKIPPLRKRTEDIELIIGYCIKKFYARKNTAITFAPDAIEYLKSYSWPGNVRELAQYLNQRLLDTWADEEEQVSLQQIMAFPPSGLSFIKENDLETFISSMKNLLENWDSSKGPFLQEVVAPVLSKLYIEDCFQLLKKTQKNNEAMDIIGISGERGKDSKLQEYYSKFQEIKDKFNM